MVPRRTCQGGQGRVSTVAEQQPAVTAQSEQWLPEILAAVRQNGFQNFSLSMVADHLGTSPRMLVYHFGSKDQLLGRLLRASRDERIHLFSQDPPRTLAAAIDRWWTYFTENLAEMDLYFFMVTRRYEQPEQFEDFAANAVVSWAAFFEDSARREHRSGAEKIGRLTVATLRGLVADFMIARDRAHVEQTLSHFLELLDQGGTVEISRS